MTGSIRCAFPVVIALAGCGAVAADVPQPLVIDQDVPVAARASLSVENVSGEIRVEAWDRETIRIHAEKARARAEEIEVKIDADPDDVRIRTIYPRRGFWDWKDSGRVAYRIQVPRKRFKQIRLVNVSGDIVASDLAADLLHLESVSGDITADRCKGPAELDTVSGNVTAGIVVEERIAVETVSGDARLSLAPSQGAWRCHVNTVSGDCALILPKAAGVCITTASVSGRTRISGREEKTVTVLKSGTVTYGNGNGQVVIETVSGDGGIAWGE